MSSVSDMLEKHGAYVTRKDILRMVCGKFQITARQAQRKINKDPNVVKVRRGIHTYYGHRQWQPPMTYEDSNKPVSMSRELYNRLFDALSNIATENIEGSSLKAYSMTKHLVAMLPQALQERLKPEIDAAEATLSNVGGVTLSLTREHQNRAAKPLVKDLMAKISALIHEIVTF